MKLLLLLVVPFFAQVECQQARLNAYAEGNISAAFDLYQTRASDIANEVYAQVNALRTLQAGISNLIPTFGKELATDYFYQSFSKFNFAGESIAAVSSDSEFLSISTGAVKNQESYGSDYLAKCVKDEIQLESDLVRYITSAPQEINAAAQEVLKFKNAVDSTCRSRFVVQSQKTKACIDSIMGRIPLPELPNIAEQTAAYLSNLYGCMQTSADKVQVVGNTALANLRDLAPEELQYTIPSEFVDTFSPAIEFPFETSLVVPSEITLKLSEAKTWIQAIKQTVKEAAAFKAMTLADTISAMRQQIEGLGNFTAEIKKKATPMEMPCFPPTESFVHNQPKATGASLLNCLVTSGQLPTAAAIAALEKSLKDREMEEKSMISTIKCALIPQDAFNPDELSKCFKSGQVDYSSFLDAVKIQADLLNTDASDVLSKAKQCVCKANVDIKKAARDEMYTLAECITQTTKVRLTVPEQACIINACANSTA